MIDQLMGCVRRQVGWLHHNLAPLPIDDDLLLLLTKPQIIHLQSGDECWLSYSKHQLLTQCPLRIACDMLTTNNIMVGLSGLEPLTPALSAQCSNRLSYRPLPTTLTAKE